MSFTHTVSESIVAGGVNRTKSQTLTGGAEIKISEAVPIAASDLDIVASVTTAQIQSMFITCDQNVTVEINSGSSPTDTLTLVANVPYIWYKGGYDSVFLGNTTTVTNFFVTNASGVAATFEAYILYDPTV